MGYILKKGGGAGSGDATAANQVTQIDILQEYSGISSVFKNNHQQSYFSDSTNEGAFQNPDNRSVFKDADGESVFISNTRTISFLTEEISIAVKNSIISANTTIVTFFTNTTLSGVAAQLQTFLQANPGIYIVNISFSSATAAQHDVLLTYNI